MSGKSEAFERLVESYILRRGFSRSYATTVRRVLRDFGEDDRLNGAAIDYILGAALSSGTKRLYIQVVNAFYVWARTYEPCLRNPAADVRVRHRSVPRSRIPTDAEVEKILRWARRYDRKTGRDAELLVKILLETGARVSSALVIRCGDLSGGRVKLFNVKIGKPYDVAIPIGEELNGLWERSARGRDPEDRLLRDGEKTLEALSTTMRRMGRDASGQHISPHSFRHMVATRMLQAGVPLDVVSKILDHSSVAITLRVYAKHSQAQIDAAFETLRDKKSPHS